MPVLELLQAGLAGRLQPTSLQLHAGERVVLLGRSGAGKSTLLGLCNGALQPDQGQLLWKGQPLNHRSRRQRCQLGTLWQDLRLVEELTALQNIQAGALGRHGWLWAIRNLLGWLDPGSCISSVQRVGLDQELLHQSVQQLSGGERQRVALARLLHQQPELMLADEPLSALDPVLANDVLATLLQAEGCLISLHRPELIHRFDRVLGLRRGELVLDQRPDQVKPNDLKWLYRES